MQLCEAVIFVLCVQPSSHTRSIEAERVQIKACSSSRHLVQCFALCERSEPRNLHQRRENVLHIWKAVKARNFLVKLLESVWNLAVRIEGIFEVVLVPIEVEVKLVVQQNWHVVLHDMWEVVVPLSEQWVVLHTYFPHNRFVRIPFVDCFVNPVEHFVTLFLIPRVTTCDVP